MDVRINDNAVKLAIKERMSRMLNCELDDIVILKITRHQGGLMSADLSVPDNE